MLENEALLLLGVLIVAAVSWLATWLLTKVLGRVVGIAGAALTGTWIAYSWWSLSSYCAQPPQFIPPEPGSASEGMMISACDAPFGSLAYFMIDFGYPLCLELWALGCLVILVRARASGALLVRWRHQ